MERILHSMASFVSMLRSRAHPVTVRLLIRRRSSRTYCQNRHCGAWIGVRSTRRFVGVKVELSTGIAHTRHARSQTHRVGGTSRVCAFVFYNPPFTARIAASQCRHWSHAPLRNDLSPLVGCGFPDPGHARGGS